MTLSCSSPRSAVAGRASAPSAGGPVKPLSLILFTLLCLSASAKDASPPDHPARMIIPSMGEFPTSVRKQLADAGALDAFVSAESITAQLISSPSDQNATENGKIAEDIIVPESKPIVLTPEQRRLLLAVLSEDSTYDESPASCFCFFTPQLRVTFHDSKSHRRFDLFLSGVGHGEIRAIQGGREIAYARTWHFIPQYLLFMDQLFPQHPITRMLHQRHEERLKDLAREQAQSTSSASNPP